MKKDITKVIVNNALICENCFTVTHLKTTFEIEGKYDRIIPDEYYYAVGMRCNKCGKLFYHFMVDGGIADLVSILNKRGYRTAYSCQGHADVRYYADGQLDNYIKISGVTPINKYYLFRYNHPYVSINGRKKLSKKMYNFFLKHGWVVEIDNYDGTNDDTYETYINDPEKAIGATKFVIRIPGKSIDEVLSKYIGNYKSKKWEKTINHRLEWWFKENIKILADDLKMLKGRT